jgi:protein-S-isoprenylcysteine O-methyltransferase Ste14
VRTGRRASLVVNAALVLLFAAFAYAHFLRWLETGRPVGLGAIALEATVAFLFIIRSPPEETSWRPIAWTSALVGSFAMLFARPVADPYPGPGWTFEIAQVVGFALAIVALGFLGRSFGIVAAVRRVKTQGLYGFVRHPIYAAYAVAYSAYVFENPSARNFTLLGIGTAAQLVRIREEERVLDRDPYYRAYRARVRYRLIPFLY